LTFSHDDGATLPRDHALMSRIRRAFSADGILPAGASPQQTNDGKLSQVLSQSAPVLHGRYSVNRTEETNSFFAAAHRPLVNINENTSAKQAAARRIKMRGRPEVVHSPDKNQCGGADAVQQAK
jgi:hypothetical protein